MNASDYQQKAARTLPDNPGFTISSRSWVIIFNALTLAHLVGQAVEMIKKDIFHRHDSEEGALLDLLCEVRKGASLNFFRRTTLRWWKIADREIMIIWCLVGLIGEVGEVCGLILQSVGNGEVDLRKLNKELGDCSWYLAGLCTKYNLDLGEVMEGNIQKLIECYPEGFNSEASTARVDVLR